MSEKLVTYEEFLTELHQELEYLRDGGTSYRVETAELSLFAAQKVDDFQLFLHKEETENWLKTLALDSDNERLNDVTKMLNTMLESLYLKAALTSETEEELLARKRKRRSLKSVPIA